MRTWMRIHASAYVLTGRLHPPIELQGWEGLCMYVSDNIDVPEAKQ